MGQSPASSARATARPKRSNWGSAMFQHPVPCMLARRTEPCSIVAYAMPDARAMTSEPSARQTSWITPPGTFDNPGASAFRSLATACRTFEDCRIGKPVRGRNGQLLQRLTRDSNTRPSGKNWTRREATGIGSWFVPMVPPHGCPLELPAQPALPRTSTHKDSNASVNARALRSARTRSTAMCEMVANWHCRYALEVTGPLGRSALGQVACGPVAGGWLPECGGNLGDGTRT